MSLKTLVLAPLSVLLGLGIVVLLLLAPTRYAWLMEEDDDE